MLKLLPVNNITGNSEPGLCQMWQKPCQSVPDMAKPGKFRGPGGGMERHELLR